ncbi:MAG: hypothetical protein WAK16_06260 [Candidatus Cybelea sp.]
MTNLRVTYLIAAAVFLPGCAATARAQGVESSCTSSIQVPFNRYTTTHIETGSTIWFSGVLEGVSSGNGGLGSKPIRIYVRQSRITFGQWQHVITLPDSTITIDPSARARQRWWVNNSAWSLIYAPSQIPEAFFDGMPYQAPEPFVPGVSGPVTWTATFTASRPRLTLSWAWSAAAYSHFGALGQLLVKPLTAPIPPLPSRAEMYQNDDPAGTPEAYKQFVIAGAMGTGVPQYTGARSDAASVTACPSSGPRPPAVPFHSGAMWVVAPSLAAPTFAWPVSQHISTADGSVWQAVVRCYATDLCALISYPNGDQMTIYSEGAAYCEPYVLHFNRTNGGRTIYSFSRDVDYDERSIAHRSKCARTRPTHIGMDGGRVILGISQNADGSLRFHFAKRILCLSAICLGIAASLPEASAAQEAVQTRPGLLQIKLETKQRTYRPNEPIELRVSIINRTSHRYLLECGPPYDICRLTVRGENGISVRSSGAWGYSNNQIGSWDFPPGTTRVDAFPNPNGHGGLEWAELTRWGYDLQKPGTYTLQCGLLVQAQELIGDKINPAFVTSVDQDRSTPIQITIIK